MIYNCVERDATHVSHLDDHNTLERRRSSSFVFRTHRVVVFVVVFDAASRQTMPVMWSRERASYDVVPEGGGGGGGGGAGRYDHHDDDDDDDARATPTMMMMPTTTSIDPFAGERASLTGRRDRRKSRPWSSAFARATAWVGTNATAWGVACAATFALGAATGALTMTRGSATTTTTTTLGAASPVPVQTAVPQLGMTQYQRAVSRARAANGASSQDRGRDAKKMNKKKADGGYPSEEEYGEEAYEEGLDGLFGGGGLSQKDTRTVLSGIKAELEDERAKLVEDDYGENKMGYYRYPSVAGNKLAFVSESNIWIGDVRGGKAARLSSTYSREGVPVLSPDGSRVAFIALTYDGYDVFIGSSTGGAIEQITTGGHVQSVTAWPENDELLIVSSAFSKLSSPQLVKVNPSTRVAEPLPFAQAVSGVKDTHHGCYVFVPLRQTSETKRYEGGEQSRLWRWCTPSDGDEQTEATNLTPESTWGVRGAWNPKISTSDKLKDMIFFLSDKEDVANLWVMKRDGSVAKSLTDECVYDIREFDIDGEDVVYRRLGDLYKRTILGDTVRGMSLSDERLVDIQLVSEFRKTAPERIDDPYSAMSEFVVTEDGAFGAFIVRGQIYYSSLLPFLGARVEKVSSYAGAVRYKHIQFVPDDSADGNQKLLALSDASGEYEYVMFERHAEGGIWKETQITTDGAIKGAMEFSMISPNSKSLIIADTSGKLKLVNLTKTAVNTADYRTTKPKDIEVNVAKAGTKSGAKTKGATAGVGSNVGGGMFPKKVNLNGARPRARLARARRIAREQRRAARHLATLGATSKDTLGLANVESMLDGLRPEGVRGLSWSPDSSHIVYAKDEANDFTTINVLELATGKETRITSPSYNSHSPKFSPDGLYLYYFSDQQIASGSNSPYGSRGSEPTLDANERLMCVPLRLGMTCPFFIGDELHSEGTVFDVNMGEHMPTVISTPYIEQRAQIVPDLPDAVYLGFDLIADGSGILLTLVVDEDEYVAVYSMYTRSVLPLYPNPVAVIVSGDLKIVTLVTEEGVALMSSEQLLQNGITQEMALSTAQVWVPPESFTVTVNPREEWLQMYEEAMRNMRDAFYDPNLHGVDWVKITDRYRPSVYRISSKSELRDILAQAFGELSALHVFVQIQSDDPTLPFGEPSSCLGGDFKLTDKGLLIERVHDNSGILESPASPLRLTNDRSHVNLMPGDIITRIDGVLVNSTSTPLPDLLFGKADTQVLLEVIKAPRSKIERRDAEDLFKLQQMRMMQQMMGGMPMSKTSTKASAAIGASKWPMTDAHMASLIRKYARLGIAKQNDKSESGKESKKEVDANAPTTELIVVTPLDMRSCDTLQAADALNINREKVKNATDDKVAYVYLEDMEQVGDGSSNSFDDFAAQFYPNIRKDGIIIDVRRNAGGNIDTWLLERLRRVAWMFDTERSGPGDTTMQYSFRGKVVVLIDEQTSSDAEMFALGIQQLKIGTVIGERTWGGAIGYSGHPELRLVDGSAFTIPSFGPYLHGDWAIEQKGVSPDITVSNLPVATFNGGDAQLDKAIEVIKKLIAKADDVALPKPPKYPNRAVDVEKCAAKAGAVYDAAALISGA